MNQPFPYPERVPQNAVERLLEQFATLQTAVQAAADTALEQGEDAGRLGKAQGLLAAEQAQLVEEAEAFKEQDFGPLLKHASALRELARRMDGYHTTGVEEVTQKLALARQLVVLTAWQICAAASGSEAAGL